MVTEARVSRRRRSVARSPALVDPADVPEDAPGRVALIAVRAPDDSLESRPTSSPDAATRSPAAWMAPLISAWGGWLLVALLAAALLVVFVIGLAFTR